MSTTEVTSVKEDLERERKKLKEYIELQILRIMEHMKVFISIVDDWKRFTTEINIYL